MRSETGARSKIGAHSKMECCLKKCGPGVSPSQNSSTRIGGRGLGECQPQISPPARHRGNVASRVSPKWALNVHVKSAKRPESQRDEWRSFGGLWERNRGALTGPLPGLNDAAATSCNGRHWRGDVTAMTPCLRGAIAGFMRPQRIGQGCGPGSQKAGIPALELDPSK